MSEPTLLDALLQIVDAAAHDDGYDHPATLWFAAADPTVPTDDETGGVTIGRKTVDGHPYDHLLGFTAPDEWTVLGVTCCGWAGSLGSERRPSMQEGRRRIRQTFLVGRSGATASAIHFQDGGEPYVTTHAGTGRMLDVLLRCLGAPTPPPEHGTDVLFTTWWLNDVVGTARTAPKRLTWKQVCDQHPGIRLLHGAGEQPLTGDPVLVGRALANVYDWSRLRALYTTLPATNIIEPHLAGWMDDGIFSRHLLGQTPSADVLLSEALDHVTPSTGRRLAAAAAELLGTPADAAPSAIDTRAWPTR